MKKSPEITHRDQLIAAIAKGEKPRSAWKIGTEHEKFVFDNKTLTRVGYEPGIRTLLEGLRGCGWQDYFEGEHLVAQRSESGASVTLEPAGQLELSGAPLSDLHQSCKEVNDHLRDVKTACAAIDATVIGLGFDPITAQDDVPWMPKGRYEIMRRYMPTRGNLGTSMMTRTCTVQVNLDFCDEADMVKKMRVSMALQPLATAIFANSPIREGALSGYKSTRSLCWTDTDPDRCGLLPFVFEDGFGYERWVDYALNVPMYFLYDNHIYHDVAGLSFRDLLVGKLPGFAGRIATEDDWEAHMTTMFPEVRLKSFIEMRGADAGTWKNLCALPAFWVGLLYDDTALNDTYALIREWDIDTIAAMRNAVPIHALHAKSPVGTMQDLAKLVLGFADNGLRRRKRAGQVSEDECEYLQDLWHVAETGYTAADRLIEKFRREWQGDWRPIIQETAY
ncbi:MAG: glutamate--cysteine ligase [Pseudomonadota bacterium]